MINTLTKILIVNWLILSGLVSAATLNDLTKYILKAKEAVNLQSGTAIAIVKGNKVIYQQNFGYVNIENQIKVDENSAFYIASITKPFFVLNALIKEHQEQLNTNVDLQSLFPKLVFSQFDAKQVSIKDLLTHTSGIDNSPLVWATAYSGIHDAESRKKLIANSYPNSNSSYGQFDYSNVGYNILSEMMNEAYPSSWQTQLQQEVFQPLEMNITSALISDSPTSNTVLAKPYSLLNADKNQALYLEKQSNTMHAAGGMISSISDMSRFLIAQLNNGAVDGKQIFPASVINKSHQKVATTDSSYLDFKRDGYAWGWYTGKYKNNTMFHHFGGYSGFHTHMSFIPSENIGIIILNNEDFFSSKLTSLIADYAYSVLLNEENIETRLDNRLKELLAKTKDIDKMIAKQRHKLVQRPWLLSLDKKEYVGRYNNKLLGDINVTLNNENEFILRWGNLFTKATAYKSQDTMRIEFKPNSGKVIKFNLTNSKVKQLALDSMTFNRI